ncbi:MAG: hypothetical protein MR673_00140 [Fusobacterium perfoetens]|uniref:hypothetical protein n=1 Tax=Fusobacterium perfoetens TaxID=852 RepID=UPI0023F0DC41|nr:hypothetical protein [Fusobacterium perfoetens]MCI6151526.1 hypothetical protein [Fusobacterium perfoetens]MDY3236725.1 hypothetical protein [Fusobacterium perfoetens]
MKKLALLLAALSVASVSYAKEVMPVAEVATEPAVVEEVKAAPVLRVTSVGQYIEIDNTSSANGRGVEDIGEAVHFGNYASLALGDKWTFDLMARKSWTADTDDGMHSDNHRIELAATRHFENFTLGVKWRGESTYDRLYIPVSYDFGLVSGWATPAYVFGNDGGEDGVQDHFYMEAEPIQLNYGPVTLAYYIELFDYNGDGQAIYNKNGFTGSVMESDYAHQVRLRSQLFSTDNFRLGAEYRYQFAQDVKYKNEKDGQENNRHIAIINAAYDVTENLTIDGYYQYEFNKYEDHGRNENWSDDYYGEFYLGWTYKF